MLRTAGKETELEAYRKCELDFVASAPTLAGLFKIVDAMHYPDTHNLAAYSDIYDNTYRGRFGNHPYVKTIETGIEIHRGQLNTPGQRYTDVQALDAEGNMRFISEYIGGKVALIDLWASWCMPCRKNSIELIPIYEEFAPKGFAIVGVGRENKNDAYMRHIVEKDGYPWPYLAEIDDSNNIWAKFGTPNAPGRTILVDRNGTILAIDPKPDELRKFLTLLLH